MSALDQENEADMSVQVPSTPQPHHATLPTNIPRALSPTTSMLVADPSSPLASQDLENSKYSSPPPPSSSMTPPPSSQPPKKQTQGGSPNFRASTPTVSILSSPPPTLANGLKRESSMGRVFLTPSPQDIAEASATDLREMLQAALADNARLDAEFREARMSAAHYKLQHNLLSIETEEAAKRMEVEHEMTRREVEVLQMAEQSRQVRGEHGSPVHSVSSRYIAELKAYCEAIDNENSLLHRRLQQAKKIMEEKEEYIVAVMEENRNFVKRIKENREHLNRLKSPGGLYAAATPRPSTGTFPVTPQRHYHGTPKATPRSMHQDHGDSQDSFAALLLADRVLNQENNSAPSTPTMSVRPSHRNHIRHNRNVQSLSSLPSTPQRSRPMTNNGNLLPSVQFAPQSEPRYRTQQDRFAAQIERERERSRRDRDSTISASDAEEIANYQSGDEEIDESQASQTASAMLRRDPRESFEVAGSPTPNKVSEKSGLLQSKLFGTVTKSGAEKRKRVDSDDFGGKKIRVSEEGVGLGIGAWA